MFEALREVYPVVSEVLDWVEPIIVLFKQYEVIILLLGFGYLIRRLKRERVKISNLLDGVSERIDTSIQQSKAAREAAESMPQSTLLNAANVNGPTHWETIRSEWQTMRDRMELAIEKISRKSTREKYSKFQRYSYNDIIVELTRDEIINAKATRALLDMSATFHRLRGRPSSTTQSDVDQFIELTTVVNGQLPKIKKQKPEAPELPLADAAE